MKLKDLIEHCDTEQCLQIVWNNDNWNDYDNVKVYSPLLDYYRDYTITKLTAFDRNVFRFRIKNEEVSE